MEQGFHVSWTGNMHINRDRQPEHKDNIPVQVVNPLIFRVNHRGKVSLGGGKCSLV